jgi:hypothetical protein
MSETSIDRRKFLIRALEGGAGVAALAASGYVGYWWRGSPTTTTTATRLLIPESWTTRGVGMDGIPFISRPDLRPPRVTLTREIGWTRPSIKEGAYFILTPKEYVPDGPGQSGLMIIDVDGELVWFKPPANSTLTQTNMQVQRYQGKSVLTWFEGVDNMGHAQGNGYIADASYQTIATIRAGNGLHADAHELNLTPQGTALITAYGTTRTDLSSVGGPKDGVILKCQAQEIDVATGKMLHAWDSLEHVGVDESEAAFTGGTEAQPYDYFHINSVALDSNGDLLISARNTWTIYKVSRDTGKIIWRLGGKKSDFSMGTGASFFWQHHARALSGGRLSIFDDGASPAKEPQSRGLVVALNERTKHCELVRAYTHPARPLAANQGSVQVLADGRVVVGWGNQPYFSEFSADGSLLFDGRFPADDQSYRSFRAAWKGQPSTKPDVKVRKFTTANTVYVSWNGDTETTGWRILAGTQPSDLHAVAKSARTGFETIVAVQSSGPYYAAEALDRNGNRLARSAVVKL